MCGICGMVDFKSGTNKTLVKKMTRLLKHRGPNGEGFFFTREVGLGVRRLSIIDIELGDQPIHNKDKSVWIIYNGEIYNFQSLRSELEPKYKFTTNSDTETILHAYEEWGVDCVKKLNGMFAFVIFDTKLNRLFIARDRFGIKPFYYYFQNNKFLFASEIKALLVDNGIKKIPNDRVVYDYLVYGLHDNTEETFFENIKQLLPAHFMIVDESGVRSQKYWDLNVNKQIATDLEKDKECFEKFREFFIDSVRLELISEVPVGTCLSGGLDSSSIVAVINNLLLSKDENAKSIGNKQKIFSSIFTEEDIDERKYIEKICSATKVDKNFTHPTSKNLWKDLRKLVYYQDEPFMSSGMYAQWEVMKLAKKKVTVVLDGQGGDELLGGYLPYFGFYLRSLAKNKKLFRLFKESARGLDLYRPFISQYLSRKKNIAATKQLLRHSFVNSHYDKSVDKWQPKDFVDMMKMELTQTSVPRLLRYEDRNSSAFSLEARVPFLDHRLVEFIFSLPMDQRIRNGWTKYILRQAMKGILPEEIRLRRSKIGFAVPEFDWMVKNKKLIKGIFLSKKFRNRKYFEQDSVVKMFDEYCKKRQTQFNHVFWRLLNLEIWMEIFIDKM